MSKEIPIIGVVDFEEGEAETTSGLVERYLYTQPDGGMSREDFAEVRREAYQIYLEDKKAGVKAKTPEEEIRWSKLNWEAAELKVAIRKWAADKDE